MVMKAAPTYTTQLKTSCSTQSFLYLLCVYIWYLVKGEIVSNRVRSEGGATLMNSDIKGWFQS